MPRKPEKDEEHKQPGSVENALRTFQLLRDHGTIRVAELAQELGVARSTAHRLLAVLSAYGAVEQEVGRPTYRVGPLLAQLGLATFRQSDLVRLLHPYLERLSGAVDETVHLIVLHGADAVFLDSVESHRQSLRVSGRVGLVSPANVTAGGKALLAELPESDVRALFANGMRGATARSITTTEALLQELDEVRANGYATNWGEAEDGVAAVATVQHSSTGEAVAAVAVSAPEQRLSPARLGTVVRELRRINAEVAPLLS